MSAPQKRRVCGVEYEGSKPVLTETESLRALNAELVAALERVVSRIDEAVDHKIHTGRMEPIGALLSEIQDGARMILERAKGS